MCTRFLTPKISVLFKFILNTVFNYNKINKTKGNNIKLYTIILLALISTIIINEKSNKEELIIDKVVNIKGIKYIKLTYPVIKTKAIYLIKKLKNTG
jgi:hypothetical protein